MSTFIRVLGDCDKQSTLLDVLKGRQQTRLFDVDPKSFRQIPGAPFAYWVSEAIRQTFQRLAAFEGGVRTVKQGLATADDFSFCANMVGNQAALL